MLLLCAMCATSVGILLNMYNYIYIRPSAVSARVGVAGLYSIRANFRYTKCSTRRYKVRGSVFNFGAISSFRFKLGKVLTQLILCKVLLLRLVDGS